MSLIKKNSQAELNGASELERARVFSNFLFVVLYVVLLKFDYQSNGWIIHGTPNCGVTEGEGADYYKFNK